MDLRKLIKRLVIGLLIGISVVCFIYLGKTNKDIPIIESFVAPTLQDNLTQNKLVTIYDDLELHFNETTCEIYIYDSKNDVSWYSNPPGRDADEIAKGINKILMNSQIQVEYINEQAIVNYVDSFTGSVKTQNYSFNYIDQGVQVTYFFEKQGFKVPIQYTLKDGYLSAEILCDQIDQSSNIKISKVKFLPFFAAASNEVEGYFVVPDGSGAKINFNNGKSTYTSYNEPIYGRDNALAVNRVSVVEDIKMPLFGIHNEQSGGVLAIIAKGEYQGEITVEVSGKKTEYNNAFSSVQFIQQETNLVLENTANEKEVTMTSEQFSNLPSFEVRYYFLDQGNSDYISMAKRYRQYLEEEKGLIRHEAINQESVPINLEVFGGIKKKMTFFGVPYNTVEVLTSYDDTITITEDLIKNNVDNISIRYLGWEKGGYQSKVADEVNAEGNLGGQKDFEKLIEFTRENNIELYPAIDLINLYKAGNGASKFFDTVKNITRAPALQYDYVLSTGEKDSAIKPWYLLEPGTVSEMAEKYTKDASKNDMVAVSLESIGHMVYSNYKVNGLSRNDVGLRWEEILGQIGSYMENVMIDDTNAYGFIASTAIANTPVFSSDYDIEDETIPFYQIVLHGYVTLYSEPVNQMANQRDYILKLVETGTYPSFLITYENPLLLDGTRYEQMVAQSYDYWKQDIITLMDNLNSGLEKITGQIIIGHEVIEKDVVKTTYEEGTVVYVNYKDEEVKVDGLTIEPKNFLVSEVKR